MISITGFLKINSSRIIRFTWTSWEVPSCARANKMLTLVFKCWPEPIPPTYRCRQPRARECPVLDTTSRADFSLGTEIWSHYQSQEKWSYQKLILKKQLKTKKRYPVENNMQLLWLLKTNILIKDNRYLKAYLSKLVCAIRAMKVASPTTWAILPRASPAAQRRIGLGLSNAPITRARADLRTSSGPRVLLFSANPFSHRHMIHYFWFNWVLTELPRVK